MQLLSTIAVQPMASRGCPRNVATFFSVRVLKMMINFAWCHGDQRKATDQQTSGHVTVNYVVRISQEHPKTQLSTDF